MCPSTVWGSAVAAESEGESTSAQAQVTAAQQAAAAQRHAVGNSLHRLL